MIVGDFWGLLGQMPPTSPNRKPNKSPTWHPPKGIYYEHNRQRPAKPYLLRWTAEGKARSMSFASEQDREEHARSLADKREEHGAEILMFDPKEWRRWCEFRELIGDVDPFDVYREWLASRSSTGTPSGSITVAKAVEAYIAHRGEGKLSADTQRHINKHVRERFGGMFGPEKLREITPGKIGDWLKSLRSSKGANAGKPVDPVTRRHHRKDLNTFLDYCTRQGWIARNPCELVAVPHVEERDVELLTVEECRSLFAANEGHRIAGRLALEAFGFLRASSAGRIQREHINFAERGIRMPGAEHKSKKAKFRQGHPDVLWAWLNRAPDECWQMSWWEYRNEKRDAFVRAGIEGGSGNRLRKTCLSAHLAWQKNQPLTSYLAQHRHTSTTDIYLGVMTERDGADWFRVGPSWGG